ncbi:MAG: CDP-diacylglycerol--glycerol-3-phosphate 3-phosphatidyltransferase [Clostridia bacterium]
MNLPNKLSIFRMICAPIMILIFMLPIPYGIGIFIASAIFIIGSFTDFLDGKIARKYNLITDFGKFIDQIADKFLATSAMILVIMYGAVQPTFLASLILIVVVLRDILVAGIRQISASKGIVIAADIFGKIKSLFLDSASLILMLYLGLIGAGIEASKILFVMIIGEVLLVIGALLSLLSGINYTLKAVPALKGSSNK